jgi:hypothetical protein
MGGGVFVIAVVEGMGAAPSTSVTERHASGAQGGSGSSALACSTSDVGTSPSKLL